MLIAASQNANYGGSTIIKSSQEAAMEQYADIGARLMRLRLAYNYREARPWCDWIDISESVWNPFEKGKRRITLDVALKVSDKTGASLDWIYFGSEYGLPPHVFDRLRSVPDDQIDTSDRRKRA